MEHNEILLFLWGQTLKYCLPASFFFIINIYINTQTYLSKNDKKYINLSTVNRLNTHMPKKIK